MDKLSNAMPAERLESATELSAASNRRSRVMDSSRAQAAQSAAGAERASGNATDQRAILSEPTASELVREQLAPERLQAAADQIQEELEAIGQDSFRIHYDRDVSRFVVSFLDDESGEVVRQIPAERVLELQKRLVEMRGLLLDEKG